ncbi:MAG: methionine--tRNA ligase [Nanoarchaeota archaeon]
MAKKKFYITTAIDYVNSDPHIGHAYEKIIADALARWHRLNDEDVLFLTGTDDNASKNDEAAKKAGIPTKVFVDKNAKKFVELCKLLNLSNDFFIRTTSKVHIKVAQDIFKKAFNKKEIYKGEYKGLYCKGCEAFKTEKDLVKGRCLEHPNTEIENIKEESYFFKLSRYQKQILKLVSKDFIYPDEWKNEIVTRLKNEKLEDLSVSRVNKDWGIRTPIDKNHRIYVWHDALLSYYSATRLKGRQKYWPADVHLIGKGINWFHSVIWPAILISAGLKLPKKILVHGYLTANGQKIGKSLGNVVDPVALAKKYSTDSLRYFLVREIPFGKDGDFSEKALIDRHNNELANDLGNLVSRSLTLATKFKGKIEGKQELNLDIKKIEKFFESYQINEALDEVWKFIKSVNKYVNDKKPWELEGKKLSNVLYNMVESLRIISILTSPFIPETAEKICKGLNVKLGKLKDCKFKKINYKVKLIPHLFEKIDIAKPINKEKIVGVITMDKIKFSDWQKLDLRVGKIKGVKDHPNAEKLYILLVDIGPIEQNIQLVAGLKQHYGKNELVGKKVIVFRNLEPAVIRGEESAGMVLAAVKDNKVVLITPDKDIDLGAKIQ